MTDPDNRDRLAELDAKLKAAAKARAPKPQTEEHYSQAELGWRMVIELVAGLLIGFGIGYGFDRLFGTIPLFLVVFTGLGFAAGVKTMLRTAQDAQEKRTTSDTPDGKTDGGAQDEGD